MEKTDESVATLASNLDEMILHNSNSANTWKKGINKLSAMTYEQVKDYYRMDAV